MENIQEIKRLIEEAENILIFTSQDQHNIDAFSSAVALFAILKKIGKDVKLLPIIIPIRLTSLAQPLLNIKNYTLTINIKNKNISNLYYEKKNNELKLSITSDSNEITKDDLVVMPKSQHPEAIISIGLQSLKDTESLNNQQLSIDNLPILNIDNAPTNELFGQKNIVETDKPISAMVCSLIESIDIDLFDKDIASLLMLGLISSAHQDNISKEVLEKMSFLKKIGIAWEKITAYFFDDNQSPKIKLLEKTLNKLSIEKVPYVFLKKDDFEDTNTSPKDLGFIVQNLKDSLMKLPSCLLLWENHFSEPKIGGIFYSPQDTINQKIKSLFNGQLKGKGVLFINEYTNPELIKKEIFKTL